MRKGFSMRGKCILDEPRKQKLRRPLFFSRNPKPKNVPKELTVGTTANMETKTENLDNEFSMVVFVLFF
jgi:hypothetical protein